MKVSAVVVWVTHFMKVSCLYYIKKVQGAALPLHSLPLGVLGVGDGITDHVLKEHLQHTAGLLVDQTGDTLHSAAASQTADGGLGDALDVITEHFAVTLSASFAESLSSFSSSTHFGVLVDRVVQNE